MKYELLRRHQLGLSISGPFSRNHRRNRRRAYPCVNHHVVITVGAFIAALLFVAAIFTA